MKETFEFQISSDPVAIGSILNSSRTSYFGSNEDKFKLVLTRDVYQYCNKVSALYNP